MEWKKTSEYTNANDVLIADYQRFLKKSAITYISQSIWRPLRFKFLINHKRSSKEEAISMKDRLGIYD